MLFYNYEATALQIWINFSFIIFFNQKYFYLEADKNTNHQVYFMASVVKSTEVIILWFGIKDYISDINWPIIFGISYLLFKLL